MRASREIASGMRCRALPDALASDSSLDPCVQPRRNPPKALRTLAPNEQGRGVIVPRAPSRRGENASERAREIIAPPVSGRGSGSIRPAARRRRSRRAPGRPPLGEPDLRAQLAPFRRRTCDSGAAPTVSSTEASPSPATASGDGARGARSRSATRTRPPRWRTARTRASRSCTDSAIGKRRRRRPPRSSPRPPYARSFVRGNPRRSARPPRARPCAPYRSNPAVASLTTGGQGRSDRSADPCSAAAAHRDRREQGRVEQLDRQPPPTIWP